MTAPTPPDDAIDEQVADGPLGKGTAGEITDPGHTSLHPLHRILADEECGGEHDQQQKEEDGKSDILVGEEVVDDVGCLIGILLRACLVACLLEGAVDKTVLRIHDSRLAVLARLLLDAGGGVVAMGEDLLGVGHGGDILLHLLVVLQKFDSEVAGGIALAQVDLLLEVLLHIADAVLDLVTVVDVDMARVGMVALHALVEADDGMEEFLHTAPRGEDRGHHRYAEEAGELLHAECVAPLLGLVVHIERTDHGDVHVDELGGEVEIALEVAGVDDVDDEVGRMVDELLANVEFLWRIGREGVGAGEIDQLDMVALILGEARLRIDRDATVVAHALMGAGGEIEERGLAAVGIADQGHVDVAPLLHRRVLQLLRREGACRRASRRRPRWAKAARPILAFQSAGLLQRDDLDEVGLTVAQANLVAHHLVFHGVLERRVEQHVHLLALDESHLDNTLAEATMAADADDDSLLSCLEF